MKRNIGAIALASVILMVIAGVTTALLAGTNALTKDTIAQRSEQAENEARLQVLAADSFEKASVTVDGESITYYKGVKGGKTAGYVFTVTSSGKSAGLVVMTGVDTAGAVTGVAVTDNNETAGYVEKVEKGGLLAALDGKTAVDGVDTISQATKTSKGILHGVEQALAVYQAIVGGNSHE